jgi:hypothetical protein
MNIAKSKKYDSIPIPELHVGTCNLTAVDQCCPYSAVTIKV